MYLWASQSGNPVLGLLLLPIFVAGPFVLVWLEVRAFLRGEPQSWFMFLLLVALGSMAAYFALTAGLSEFFRMSGLWKVHALAMGAGLIGLPFSLCWELYKRGWFAKTGKPR